MYRATKGLQMLLLFREMKMMICFIFASEQLDKGVFLGIISFHYFNNIIILFIFTKIILLYQKHYFIILYISLLDQSEFSKILTNHVTV